MCLSGRAWICYSRISGSDTNMYMQILKSEFQMRETFMMFMTGEIQFSQVISIRDTVCIKLTSKQCLILCFMVCNCAFPILIRYLLIWSSEKISFCLQKLLQYLVLYKCVFTHIGIEVCYCFVPELPKLFQILPELNRSPLPVYYLSLHPFYNILFPNTQECSSLMVYFPIVEYVSKPCN